MRPPRRCILTLTSPDGGELFFREIPEEHVITVAQFLRDNMGIFLAARGAMDAVRGLQDVIAGNNAIERARGRR